MSHQPVMIGLLTVGLLTAAVLTGCSTGRAAQFHQTCTDRGGFVAETGSSFWVTRIDCIVDNRVVYLPGFAP